MESYSILRQFADSWGLLVMLVFFLGVIVWAFRPGSGKIHSDTANIPFRHSDAPAPVGGDDNAATSKEARP